MKVSITKKWKVKPPTRATSGSAGMDVFIPDEFNKAFVSAFSDVNRNPRSDCFIDAEKLQLNIHPLGKISIPTGLRMEVPKNCMLLVENKSGVSWNDRVSRLACVIDQDYQGEIFITLTNINSTNTVLLAGQKVAQIICVPIEYPSIELVEESEIHLAPTERMSGAFGSTGK